MANKDVVLAIGADKYNFNSIVKRTIHAPVIEIKTAFFRKCKASGIDEIDNSDLRIYKKDNRYHLLTGYNKINEALTNSTEIISAKLMSSTYLESTLVPPKQLGAGELRDKSLVDKLSSAGFRVRVSVANSSK